MPPPPVGGTDGRQMDEISGPLTAIRRAVGAQRILINPKVGGAWLGTASCTGALLGWFEICGTAVYSTVASSMPAWE